MGEVARPNRTEIIRRLVKAGAAIDSATMYADAFLEYREASDNINEYGVIVQHPRTGNPVPNPYLEVRNGALRKLRILKHVKADFLWAESPKRPKKKP